MEKEIALGMVDRISRQRNLFLGLCLLSVSCSLVLALKVWSKDERVILVPGLSQQVWLEGGGVSSSYVAEIVPMFLSMLLNLSADNVDYNSEKILSHVSHAEPQYLSKIQDYFFEKSKQYKDFGISTYFSERVIIPNSKELSAVVHGRLKTIFRDSSQEDKEASYKLNFEWTGGRLKLKEFTRIKSEEEKAKITQEQEKIKQLKEQQLKNKEKER